MFNRNLKRRVEDLERSHTDARERLADEKATADPLRKLFAF